MIFYGLDERRQSSISRRDWIYGILQSAAALGIGSALYAREDQSGIQFFTAEQNETLIALGERIVPGSAAAACNRVIDLIMTVESGKTREELLHALAEFDKQAQTRYQKQFHALTPEQQDGILESAADDHAPLHFEFSVVKEWIADAYWSSEKGLRELGWTGRVAWEEFPGCGHPGTHN